MVKKSSNGSDPIECIRNDSKVRLKVRLECFEFTWNCPSVQQPDFGKVIIEYTPNKLIAETKAMKFYLQQYRARNAFNEELAVRIAYDFIYYVKPAKLKLSIEQNSRGGIYNSSVVEWDSENPADKSAWINLGYQPKKGFQGGWTMISAAKRKTA